jgi:hypothetical protein
MKKITLVCITFLITTIGFSQNLVVNGDFESGGTTVSPVPDWSGFKNRVVTDDLTTSLSGQVENGDGSLFQVLSGLTPGATYNVSFDYRWVGEGATVMTMRVKDELNVTGTGKPNLNLDFDGATSDGFTLLTTVDAWEAASFSITLPAGVSSTRLLFYKANGNRPLNLDNVSVSLDGTASVKDLAKFSFRSYPNPVSKQLFLSASEIINKVEIYNLVGQKVASQIINATNDEVEVQQLSKGIYILKTYIEDAIGTQKFIKE